MKTMTRQEIGRQCVTAMAGLYSLSHNAKKMALDEVSGGPELQELAADAMKRINEIIEEHGK